MKGQVLDFTVQSNSGVITTEEGKRYTFEGAEWKESQLPTRGMEVDFDVDAEGKAVGVYKALHQKSSFTKGLSSSSSSGEKGSKNKVIAGVLALILGQLGVHKFYLGALVPGFIYLGVSLLSFGLVEANQDEAFFFPLFVIVIFSIIDAFMYFLKSDEDFHRIYVEDKKQWF